MKGRKVANSAAGLFLLAVAVLVAWGVWELFQGPDAIVTAPLVEDLAEFVDPVGAASSPVVVTECTGEGSFPAYAERSVDVDGDVGAAEADLRVQAADLGWVETPSDVALGGYERGSRVLSIDVQQSLVVLHVATDNTC